MIVGIDIGTQSLKAVVTDDALALRGEAKTVYRPDFPRPGFAEQDPALWERALGPAIAGALEAAGARADDVRALGIAGQLDGCIATGADGRALVPAIVWMDRRAEAEISGLPAEAIRARSGLVLDAGHMAAKIRWQKRHLPEVAAAAVCFHQPVSWLVERLTGARVLDHGLASTTMLYGLAERAFVPELLELFEIEASELPALAEAEALAGRLHAQGAALTGLPPGLPVAVGTGDDFAAPLGAGVLAPGPLVCVLGTAEVVGALHDRPVIDEAALVETHAYAGGRFFVENPGWLSGGAVTWLCALLGFADAPALDAAAASVPAGADGVVFLPALTGAMTPRWVAGARGCFYGLTPAHHKGHLARALLEGTAFAMADVVERLNAMGVASERLLLLGGGARSALWARIRADLTGLAADLPEVRDTTARGAAALAATAAGSFARLAEAVAMLEAPSRRIEPDAEARPALVAAHRRQQQLFECLRPLYETPA